jgi:hypothetical protein
MLVDITDFYTLTSKKTHFPSVMSTGATSSLTGHLAVAECGKWCNSKDLSIPANPEMLMASKRRDFSGTEVSQKWTE